MIARITRNRRFALALAVGVLLLLAAQGAAAQEIDPGDIPALLPDAARWLGSAAVTVAAAYLLQRSAWYQAMETGWIKDLVGAFPFWALPALSSLLLRMLGMMSQAQLEGAQSLWNWALMGLLTWLAWQPARGAMALHGKAVTFLEAQTAWYKSAMQPDAMGTPRRG